MGCNDLLSRSLKDSGVTSTCVALTSVGSGRHGEVGAAMASLAFIPQPFPGRRPHRHTGLPGRCSGNGLYRGSPAITLGQDAHAAVSASGATTRPAAIRCTSTTARTLTTSATLSSWARPTSFGLCARCTAVRTKTPSSLRMSCGRFGGDTPKGASASRLWLMNTGLAKARSATPSTERRGRMWSEG